MKDLTKASRKLSYLLRHDPKYIDRNGGWADVDTILSLLQRQYPYLDRPLLDQLVAEDQKGRYSFDGSGTRIRANQGHSVPGVVVEMEERMPPALLYHGTSSRFLKSILAEGLRPMGRLQVHLSSDVPTAKTVGRRHGGQTVILEISARKMMELGYRFYLSANHVWLVEYVPITHLRVLDQQGMDTERREDR